MAIEYEERITVGIVGGGIGGLMLAKMLEMSGISFIVFESHELAPVAGASIGLMPSGLRLLDQIGVIGEVEKWAVQHDKWEHRDSTTGELYATSRAMRAYPSAFGYGAFFMERVQILRTILESIKNKSKLREFSKVVSAQLVEDGVVVQTQHGQPVHCQLVVGADGVHSVVRGLIREQLPDATIGADYLTAETFGMFGTSPSVPQIGEGRHFTVYQEEASVLVFSGRGGKLYWFIFRRFPEPVKYGQGRRMSEEDGLSMYHFVSDLLITDGVRFSEIFEQREFSITLPVEEGVCKDWHADRMCLLGDAMHKMTPHAAMGANLAWEDAAVLVNRLRALRDQRSDHSLQNISVAEIAKCLEAYALEQKERALPLVKLSSLTQKIQLKQGPAAENFLKALPNMTDADWLQRGLGSLSQAKKLENWQWDSARVCFFDKQAQRIQAGELTAAAVLHGMQLEA